MATKEESVCCVCWDGRRRMEVMVPVVMNQWLCHAMAH